MSTTKYQIAAWTALATIVFVTVSPIELRPGDVFSVDADRALAFGLLSAMFMIAYPRQALFVGTLVVIGAGAIELLQALSPSRHARLDDAIVKAIGAICGMVLATIYNLARTARHASRRVHRERAFEFVSRRQKASPVNTSLRQLPVSSKMIEAVYFSQEDGELRIRLRGGDERRFTGVDIDAATSLVTAPSPGKFYLEEIRTKFRRLAA